MKLNYPIVDLLAFSKLQMIDYMQCYVPDPCNVKCTGDIEKSYGSHHVHEYL